MIRYRLFAPALLIVLASRALAQAPDTATIEGHITDQSRAAISGADVTIMSPATGFERETRSDAGGRFSLSALPIGAYSLRVHRDGFAEVRREITLVSSTTADVKIQLNVSEVDTQIQVAGTAGAVRSDEPQLGDRLGPVQVEETPLLKQ